MYFFLFQGMEVKSLHEICEFLEEQGFPNSVLDSFRGWYTLPLYTGLIMYKNATHVVVHELDGSAIAVGIASSPGPNWLMEVIPT